MADQFTWRAPDGTTIELTDWDSGYYVTPAGTGLRSPSYEVSARTFAGIDGVEVQRIRAIQREFTLGLFVDAASSAEFRVKARGLVRAMRPKEGPGTLTVTTDAGEARNLDCYCVGGLEGSQALDVNPGTWWRMVLNLYAPDPWWYGDEQTVDVGLGAPTLFFPIPPLTLSSSVVQGQFVIDLSDADAPSYPQWTITGPGTGLVLTNTTTGQSITVNATLSSGQQMLIDTRPGYQSVRRNDGTNLMGSVASDPALWPLIADVNQVTAALTGATAASRIAGTYQPRFAGI